MKELKLQNSCLTALVDDEDYDRLSQWKWYLKKGRNTNYAARIEISNNTRISINMHRVILKLTDSKIFGDHRDRDGLNNQRSNLRIATCSQNCANTISKKNSSSIYLGVSYSNTKRMKAKWVSTIGINYKQIHLGSYKTEVEAAKAYDEAAKKYHGEFARLNEI